MKQATPQDTYDHMFGSGALSFSWWRGAKILSGIKDGIAEPDWAVEVTCENGDGGRTTTTVNHASVLRAAHKVIQDLPEYASSALVRECKNLVCDADEIDFDAASGVELLQVICLGDVVFC